MIQASLSAWLSSIAILVFPVCARADLDPPVRNVNVFITPVEETLYRVGTAKVLLADYPLLKHDFPVLRSSSDAEIDAWLIDKLAYISKPQAEQTVVNTPIELGRLPSGQVDERWAMRPEGYNRAHVLKVAGGFIDVKGSGSLHPQQVGHGNGLATVGEAIREFIFQKMVQKIFAHAQVEFQTVANYGVIDYGFDVKHADGSTSPAGLVFRQAHERLSVRTSGLRNTFLSRENTQKVERILRYYGMTSSGERDLGPERDLINLQGLGKAVVDFGSFLVRPLYKNKSYYYDDFQTLNAGGTAVPILDPEKPGWLDPNPRLRLPFEIWGYSVSGDADPKADNIWIWSHELASHIRQGTATRQDAWAHYIRMTEAVSFPAELSGVAKAAELGACVVFSTD